MLVLAHNLPQTAPYTIANYRAAEETRGNKTNTTQARILDCRYADH